MNTSAGRSYFGIQKIFLRVVGITAILLVGLAITPKYVFAQAQYGNYTNLFNNGPLSSKLTILKKFDFLAGSTTQVTTNLQFQFISSFDLSVGGSAPKQWHWDHIEDFAGGGSDGGSVSFLLRICDTGVANEGACYFSVVPHKSQMATDTAICPNGPLNCSTFPNQATQSVPKIYHYTVVQTPGSFPESIQNDKFNVTFNTTRAATLGSGALNAAVNLDSIMQIGDQKTYKADIWYCATSFGSETLPTTEANSGIRFFNDLCGSGNPYFRIAESQPFKLPNTLAEAATEAGTTTAPEQVDSSAQRGDGLPECSMSNGTFGSGSFMGCIARLIYYVIYWPIAWFAGLLGVLFDFFIGYSLSDASYRADFAIRGWQIVRDISNIFFIIILVWTGLSTVFGVAKRSMKQVVPNLILNALLINFSLFATRVVIDVSNIVARVFYNSIHVCQGPCEKEGGNITNFLTGPGGYKSLSTKIISSFNPQKIFNTGVLDQAKAVKDVDNNQAAASDSQIAGYFIIVSFIAAAILFAIAMMFWKTAFFFLGRVIGLYVAMIFAPFAFLSREMPLIGGIKQLSWGDWLSDLTKYAMLAPIFVFFLYIIYSLIESDFIKVFKVDIGSSFFETVIFIAIPMLIVYFMIKQGVGIAENYAGEIGKKVQGWVDKTVGGIGGVVGGGVGLAAGGAAFFGRNTLGRGVRAVTNKTDWGKNWQKWAASNADTNAFARLNNKFINRTQTGSFDARNLGVKIGKTEYTAGGTLGKSIGLLGGGKLVDKLSGNMGLGQDKALGKSGKAGGVKKLAEEREKKRAERIAKNVNYSHLSDSQAKEVWEKKKTETANKYAEKHWQDHIDADSEVKPHVEAMKTAETALKTAENALADAKKKGTTFEQTIATNKFNDAKIKLAEAEKKLTEEKARIIKDINDGKHSKEEAAKKALEAEKDRLDRYGNIKNASGLEMAMRAEFAEDLRKNSFWMKDGKPRYINAAMQAALGTTLAVALPGVGTLIGGALVAAVARGLVNNNKLGHVVDRATEKLINDAKKAQGRGNAERQLTDKIDDLKKKVVDTVKKHTGKSSDKFDDYKQDELEDSILKETVDLEEKIRTETDKYTKRKLQKTKEGLEDALDEIERKQEKLDKIKENKEKKSNDGDKSKEKPKEPEK